MMKKGILILLLVIGLCTFVNAIGLTNNPDMGTKELTIEDTLICENVYPCGSEWTLNIKGQYECGNMTYNCNKIKDEKFCMIYTDWVHIEGKAYQCPVNNITKACNVMNAHECVYDKTLYHYIEMYQGETLPTWIEVQNVEDKEYTVKFILQSDDNIVEPIEKTLTLAPEHQNNPKVYFDIKIPKDAIIGTEYEIKYSISTNAELGSQVSFEFGVPQMFKVKVVEQPKEEKELNYWHYIELGAGIIIVVIIMVLIFNRKKGEEMNEE